MAPAEPEDGADLFDRCREDDDPGDETIDAGVVGPGDAVGPAGTNVIEGQGGPQVMLERLCPSRWLHVVGHRCVDRDRGL